MVSYEELARDLKLESPTRAANLLVTGKRMYGRLLRAAVGEYEMGEGEQEAEIAELCALFGAASGSAGGVRNDMDGSSVDRLGPEELVRMLRLEEGENGWETEWTAAVEHQLAAGLLPDLEMVAGAEVERLRRLVVGRIGAETFLRQLTFISPSLELLEAIKRFGREKREEPGSPLRGNGGTLIYYAAIAAALVRCKTRITGLSDERLREGFSWGLAQPVAALHGVFAAALEALGAKA